ncbi:MAG: hypothetical protein HOM21_17615 [Halobacteriovoraceae bacterium]|nr:hypothetical protein [Halobacteriovoraceae bacterium]
MNEKNFSLNFEKFKSNVKTLYGEYREVGRLKPPDSVKLLIQESFIRQGSDITAKEFRILCTLTEFNRVGDVYQNSDLMSFEVTRALVSLRKKAALKVIKAI